ncbi:STAS domain-containing protein [Streptomyces sp. Qhu_M48]|uniref:STAS domain-containing protein n=1 Tax=Streptomyces sp. Qhu_M48 TaxID=3435889 RepID=UPI003F4FD69D
MTRLPQSPFTVTVEAGSGTAYLYLAGDLDHDTSDELAQHADRCLDAHPDLRDLRLDCTRLRFCDTMGISALLMIHRKTTARNIGLHLDNQPAFLDRILNTTGVRHLFSSSCAFQKEEQALSGNPSPPHAPQD